MKKSCITLICLLISLWSLATNVSKSIKLSEAGTLTSLLTNDEKTSITNLTITGSIDARDIRCLRIELTNLSVLDLSETDIEAYRGTEGTVSGSVSYPEDEMPQYSFYNSSTGSSKTSLTTIIFPISAKSIGKYACYKCSNLSKITLYTNLTKINDHAFYYCPKLSDFSLPNTLETIGEYAFAFCSNSQTDLVISDSVTSIGSYAFGYLNKLKTVSIGSSISSIASYCFCSCSKLTTISIQNETPPSLASRVFYNCSSLDTIYVPASSINDYKSSFDWKSFSHLIYALPSSTENSLKITVDYSVGGTVYNGGVLIVSGGVVIVDSCSVDTFEIKPVSGYSVDFLIYNNTDVLDKLINNQYITDTIREDATLHISFVNSSANNSTDTVYIHDTTFVNTGDTSYVTIYDSVSICDTILITVLDSSLITVYDTSFVTVLDSSLITVYDTISVTDTLYIDVAFSGITEKNSSFIKVYPNPTNDLLYLNFGDVFSELSNYNISIVSIEGKLIYNSPISQSLTRIHLQDFAQKGMYLLQIIDKNSGDIVDIKKIILK